MLLGQLEFSLRWRYFADLGKGGFYSLGFLNLNLLLHTAARFLGSEVEIHFPLAF